MSDKRREAVNNAGAFLGPGMVVPAPVNALNVGVGEPGPEDDWKIPVGPTDEIPAEPEPVLVPAREGLLHRLIHKG